MEIILCSVRWHFFQSLQNIFLITILVLFFSKTVYGQNPKYSNPDGTEGEMFEAPKKDSAKLKWNEKRWRLFKGRITTFKLGAGFLCEYAAFSRD
jgi:phosphate-selective porin OprO/OprP